MHVRKCAFGFIQVARNFLNQTRQDRTTAVAPHTLPASLGNHFGSLIDLSHIGTLMLITITEPSHACNDILCYQQNVVHREPVSIQAVSRTGSALLTPVHSLRFLWIKQCFSSHTMSTGTSRLDLRMDYRTWQYAAEILRCRAPEPAIQDILMLTSKRHGSRSTQPVQPAFDRVDFVSLAVSATTTPSVSSSFSAVWLDGTSSSTATTVTSADSSSPAPT